MANWKAKKNNNQYEQKKKDFVPNRNSKNNKAINYPNNKNFQGNKNNSPNNQNNSKGKEFANNHGNYTKNFERKEPIKCWECNGPHYALVCHNRKKTVSNIHTIQEEMTVGELARTMPRINAALENRQEEYQTSIVEVEGTINHTPKAILIDPGASLSYIRPQIVEKCKLSVEKIKNSWLVQLATGAKRKVTCFVKECAIVMDKFETIVKLNVLPLGSYDLMIGMY